MEIRQLQTEDGTVIASQVAIAKSLYSRTIGLMFRSGLPEGHGLAIVPCSSIHTFFMRFQMDAAFVDYQDKVKHIIHSMRPWRVSRYVRGAAMVVELPGGTLKSAGIKVGDRLRLV